MAKSTTPGIDRRFANPNLMLTFIDVMLAQIGMTPDTVWMVMTRWRLERRVTMPECSITPKSVQICERNADTRAQSGRTGARQRADADVASPVDKVRSRGSGNACFFF